MQHLAHREYRLQLGGCIGPGIQGPDADVLLADEQALALVVGDAALGLAGHLELAHQAAGDRAAGAVQAVLQEGAVLAVGEGIELARRRLVQADTVDFLERRAYLAQQLQRT
ncbi:hypothetical protein D9M70_568540 [compost metagenome]